MRSLAELMSLEGRAALVTGGAGHIGLAACEALLELGCSVAVLDLDADRCQARVAKLTPSGNETVIAVPCDLLDEKSTRAAVGRTVEELGGLDILIHCAGYVGTTSVPGWMDPFDRQTVAAWDAAMRVNLTSAFVMVQEAREALASSGHGAVVLLSSIYGVVAPDFPMYEEANLAPSPAAYVSSKGGILQMTRYFSTLLAPRVRANSITPGGVWRNQPEVFVERYSSRTPLGRMATEQDLKGAVAYLASDLSAYVTGHNLVVDGGWTVW